MPLVNSRVAKELFCRGSSSKDIATSFPQCLHIIASDFIISAQKGHFLSDSVRFPESMTNEIISPIGPRRAPRKNQRIALLFFIKAITDDAMAQPNQDIIIIITSSFPTLIPVSKSERQAPFSNCRSAAINGFSRLAALIDRWDRGAKCLVKP